MNIDSIKNGIVLDHIRAGRGMQIYNSLGLDQLDCSVAIIKNVKSSKMGKKDIIKISDAFEVNFDVLGYIDPEVTVCVIENGSVKSKHKVELPEKIVNIAKCKNPRCITSVEQEIDHVFKLTDREHQVYRCIYCESKLKKIIKRNKRYPCMKQESRTNINRVKKDISSPDSFTPPEELKRQLITTMQSIYDEEDIEAVERAYKVAYKAHEKQKRKSGEPYIIHPICVAIILAELELDKETIMAGLLHDVVEDTETTHEDIVRDFGEEVAQLVDGVTKLGQLSYSKDKIEVQGGELIERCFLQWQKISE